MHSAAAHEPPKGTANGGESSDGESSTALHMPCYAPLYKVTCGCGCGARQLLHRYPLRTEKRKLPELTCELGLSSPRARTRAEP